MTLGTSDRQGSGSPVNIANPEPGNFSEPQAESKKEEQHRLIAQIARFAATLAEKENELARERGNAAGEHVGSCRFRAGQNPNPRECDLVVLGSATDCGSP